MGTNANIFVKSPTATSVHLKTNASNAGIIMYSLMTPVLVNSFNVRLIFVKNVYYLRMFVNLAINHFR